jgi:hypothetical protein
MDFFMGFQFLQVTELTKTSRIRNCFAYAADGLVLGDWEDVQFTAGNILDKNNEIVH